MLENVIFELFSEYDVRKSFKHYIFSNTLEDINEIDQIWQKFNINVKSRFFIGHLNVIGFSILEFFQISFTILLIIKFL